MTKSSHLKRNLVYLPIVAICLAVVSAPIYSYRNNQPAKEILQAALEDLQNNDLAGAIKGFDNTTKKYPITKAGYLAWKNSSKLKDLQQLEKVIYEMKAYEQCNLWLADAKQTLELLNKDVQRYQGQNLVGTADDLSFKTDMEAIYKLRRNLPKESGKKAGLITNSMSNYQKAFDHFEFLIMQVKEAKQNPQKSMSLAVNSVDKFNQYYLLAIKEDGDYKQSLSLKIEEYYKKCKEYDTLKKVILDLNNELQ